MHFRHYFYDLGISILKLRKNQGSIRPAKPERVGHGDIDRGFTGDFGHIIQIALFIRIVEIDGRRHLLPADGQVCPATLSRLAKAIKPKPSSAGLRSGIASESPRPRAVTNGTVTVDVVTPPESYASAIIFLGVVKV